MTRIPSQAQEGQRRCENCQAAPLRRFPTANSVMWHCPNCQLYQQGQLVGSDDYGLTYHRGYAVGRRRKLRTALVRLGRLASLLETDRPKLLDVGCSLGYTVQAAEQLGWQAVGVDLNAQVIGACRQRGLDCRLLRDDRLPFPDGHFDALTAWHVIEHVADVATTLAEWARVVRPGGVIALETPNSACLKVRLKQGRYASFWAPEHTYTFNRRNLTQLVLSAGLEPLAPASFGRLAVLPAGMTPYAVVYSLFGGLQRAVGLGKAFQLFCRTRQVVQQAVRGRKAA